MPKLPLPTKYTVRLIYDDDSVRAEILIDDEAAGRCGYNFVRTLGGWEQARKAALQDAADRIAQIERYGQPPKTSELVDLDQLPEPTLPDEE